MARKKGKITKEFIKYPNPSPGMVDGFSPNQKKEFLAFLPHDKPDCPCQKHVLELKVEFSHLARSKKDDIMRKHNYRWDCERINEPGMKHYDIKCNNCDDKVGEVWAKNKDLVDWCNFHYFNYVKRNGWRGAMIPHISPVDLQIGFECACGMDTRDFRANQTLPKHKKLARIARTKKGRRFNKSDSIFRLEVST